MKTAWFALMAAVALIGCRDDRQQADAAGERTSTPAADSVPAPAPDDELGPFAIDGRQFTVKFDKQRYASDEHVVRLRIVDEDSTVHVEERYDSVDVVDDALEYTITVGATALRGDRGEGLLLWYEYAPAAPLSGMTVKVFTLNNDRLIALSPAVRIYGTFQDLPRDSATGRERLLPGDIMNVEVRQRWFGVIVPLFVDLGGCAPVGGSTCIRPQPQDRDEPSGFAVFDVVGHAAPVPADTSVVLYSGIEGKVIGTVPVRRSSRVSLVAVAADPVVSGEEGFLDISVQHEWLRVRIDTRSGWLHGEPSFRAIGLRPTQ